MTFKNLHFITHTYILLVAMPKMGETVYIQFRLLSSETTIQLAA